MAKMPMYKAELRSLSPYSQSKFHDVPKKEKEQADAYEARTWRERLHVMKDEIFIPPMALKNCLSECAKYLGMQIPGRGKNTYTKHVEAGVMITEPIFLGIKKDDAIGEWFFMDSQGRRGGSSRVKRCYPMVPEWKATVEIHVIDETITEDVLKLHLEEAGKFIGIGRFRPRNNGFYGRFELLSLTLQ